jgi:DNA-binding MurR/RpiR family transcriptional regulator
MNNIFLKISESIDSLASREKLIAKYILKHKDKVIKMTITQLAESSKTSPASIVRFYHKIGYNSYRDFQQSLFHGVFSEDAQREDDIYALEKRNPLTLSVEDTITIVTQLNVESLINTLKIIDMEEVTAAVHAINEANHVGFYALSGSRSVADDAVFKFERLGVNCRSYSSPHSQLLSAKTMSEKDVAVFISYSGETKDLIEAANAANKRGIKTISITRYGETTLKEICAINIQHSSIGRSLRTISTRSRVVQQNIIDILHISLAKFRTEFMELYHELFNHPIKLKERNKKDDNDE